jgi:hypothetical protein
MLPFGVTIPATVPQGSEIPEGLMNNSVYFFENLWRKFIYREIEFVLKSDKNDR